MKIIIVGAGICGCATYLFLRKTLPAGQDYEIVIYEKHLPPPVDESSPGGQDIFKNVIGAGLGVQPNGMRVLRNLSEEIHDSIVEQGFIVKKMKFKTPQGWVLGSSHAGDRGNPEEFCLATSRHGVQQGLAKWIPQGVIRYKAVKSITVTAGRKPVVHLADGSEDEGDLVVGTDGVKSAVKRGIFGEEDERLFAPEYGGGSGLGGLVKVAIPEKMLKEHEMVFTWGDPGSFGGAPADGRSRDQLLWWSADQSEKPPKREDINPAEVREKLRKQLRGWNDPLIQEVLEKAEINTLWPVFTTPDLPLWGRDGCVIAGDAAHCLNPSAGQGVSQALEDAETVALLLAGYLRQTPCTPEGEQEAIRLTIEGLYDIRKDRVKRFADQAKNLGSANRPRHIWFVYIVLWAVTHFEWLGKLVFGDLIKVYAWRAKDEVERKLSKRKDLR